MFQIGVIVFREILEIALVVSILFAAMHGFPRRTRWILSGLFLGLLASSLIAIFTNNISELFQGIGQDVFNAVVLLCAMAMISYTVIWMNGHAKNISQNLRKLGKSVAEGNKSLMVLLLVIFFSVLREGTEVVLFGYGALVSGTSIHSLIIGGAIGLAGGILAGFTLYFGIMKAFGKYFFTITSWLLIFLAAGMTAKAMGFLSAAGLIPELRYQLWDTSHIISENGILGTVLSVLFGYISRPSGIQVLSYAATLLLIYVGISFDKKFLKSAKS